MRSTRATSASFSATGQKATSTLPDRMPMPSRQAEQDGEKNMRTVAWSEFSLMLQTSPCMRTTWPALTTNSTSQAQSRSERSCGSLSSRCSARRKSQ